MELQEIDRKCLEQFIAGDHKSFELIYRTYGKTLYRRLFYMLKDADQVDEALQLIFVKLWMKRDELSLDRNFAGYVMQMTQNTAIDFIRKNIKNRLLEEIEQAESISLESVEDSYLIKERRMLLEAAINQLPAQRQRVFTLCKIEGYSYQEVSEMLNISTATISNHLTLAMKSIKDFTSKHQNEIKTLLFIMISLKII